MVRIFVAQNVVNVVMGNSIEMSWAIVPKDVNDGEVPKVSPSNLKVRLLKSEGGMNDDVDGNQSERRVDFSPLEVMFRAYLNRGWSSKTEGDDGFINGTMSELALSSISLKGTKLPIGPPVLVMGKRGEEDGRVGGERASGVFRGNN